MKNYLIALTSYADSHLEDDEFIYITVVASNQQSADKMGDHAARLVELSRDLDTGTWIAVVLGLLGEKS